MRYEFCELRNLDDLGYVQQSREEMEVLFVLLAERYERGSVLLTSNLPFSGWESIFKDPMTTAAAIDRLVHHSVIVELNIPSYRAEQARKAKRAEAPIRRMALGQTSRSERRLRSRGIMVDFLRHGSGDHRGKKKTPRAWLDPRSQVPGGTPSAGLSLGRLRPRRARLRFTRRENRTARRIVRARSVGQPIGKSNCR